MTNSGVITASSHFEVSDLGPEEFNEEDLLSRLPIEPFLQILEKLKAQELTIALQVSRKWYRLASCLGLWKRLAAQAGLPHENLDVAQMKFHIRDLHIGGLKKIYPKLEENLGEILFKKIESLPVWEESIVFVQSCPTLILVLLNYNVSKMVKIIFSKRL